MEINTFILDYLKHKKALVTLCSSVNNSNSNFVKNEENRKFNFSENNNNTDSDEDFDIENNKEILGSCKFSLNEILIETEFANKNYEIISLANTKVNFGYINIDLKLENSASIEGRIFKKEKVNFLTFYFFNFIRKF